MDPNACDRLPEESDPALSLTSKGNGQVLHNYGPMFLDWVLGLASYSLAALGVDVGLGEEFAWTQSILQAVEEWGGTGASWMDLGPR